MQKFDPLPNTPMKKFDPLPETPRVKFEPLPSKPKTLTEAITAETELREPPITKKITETISGFIKPIEEKIVEKTSTPLGEVLTRFGTAKKAQYQAPPVKLETLRNMGTEFTPEEQKRKGQAPIANLISGVLPEKWVSENIKIENPTPDEQVLGIIGSLAGMAVPIGAEYTILNKFKTFEGLIKSTALTSTAKDILLNFGKRTVGRGMRGLLAGTGYALYEGEQDPKTIAETALGFAALDGAFGTIGDAVRAGGRVAAELEGLGATHSDFVGAREKLYIGIRNSDVNRAYAEGIYKSIDEPTATKLMDEINDAKRTAENDLKKTQPIPPITEQVPAYKLTSDSLSLIKKESARLGVSVEKVISYYTKTFRESEILPEEVWKVEHYTAQGYSLDDAIKMVEPDEITMSRIMAKGYDKAQAERIMLHERTALTRKYESARGSVSGKKTVGSKDFKTYAESQGEIPTGTVEPPSITRSFKEWIVESRPYKWSQNRRTFLRNYVVYEGRIITQQREGVFSKDQYYLHSANKDKFKEQLMYKDGEINTKIQDLIRPILELKNVGKWIWSAKSKVKLLYMTEDYLVNLRALRHYERNPDYLHEKSPEQVLEAVNYYRALGGEAGNSVIMSADNIIKNLHRYALELLIPRKYLHIEQVEANPDYTPLVVLDFIAGDARLGMGKIKKSKLGFTISGAEGSYRIHSRDVIDNLRRYFFLFERRVLIDDFVAKTKEVFYKKEMYDEWKKTGKVPQGWKVWHYDGGRYTLNGQKIASDMIQTMKDELKPYIKEPYQDVFEQIMNGNLRPVEGSRPGFPDLEGKAIEPVLLPESVYNDIDKFAALKIDNPLYSVVSGGMRFLKKAWTRGLGYLSLPAFTMAFLLRNFIPTDMVNLVRDGGVKYHPDALRKMSRLFGINKDEFTKIMTAAEEAKINLKMPQTKTFLPKEIRETVFNYFMEHGGAQTGHWEGVTGGTTIPRSMQFIDLETNPFKWTLRQYRGRMMEGRLGYDTARAVLEGSSKLARMFDAVEKEWGKVLDGKVTRENFDQYGLANAWHETNTSMGNYLHIPEGQRRYLSNLSVLFWGWTYVNSASWYNAILNGNARSRTIGLAAIATTGLAVPIYAYLTFPDVMEAINDPNKPWLRFMRKNFCLPLREYTTPDGKEYADVLSFSSGADDFINIGASRDIMNAWMRYAFHKKTLGEAIVDTFAAPFTGTGGYLWDAASPIFKKPVDWRTGRAGDIGIDIYKKDDPDTEKALKIVLDGLFSTFRTARSYTLLLNGEEWSYNYLVKYLGEDTAKDIYEYLKIKQTNPVTGVGEKILRSSLSIKTIRIDAPEPKKKEKPSFGSYTGNK
jgi:hypothetical protein